MATCPPCRPEELWGDPVRVHVLDDIWCTADFLPALPDGGGVDAQGIEVNYWEWVGGRWLDRSNLFRDPEPEPFQTVKVRWRFSLAGPGPYTAPEGVGVNSWAVSIQVNGTLGGRRYSPHPLVIGRGAF
jgi:hypothetical protein